MYKQAYLRASEEADRLAEDPKKAARVAQREGIMSRISATVEDELSKPLSVDYISRMRRRVKEEGPKVEGGSVTGMATPDTGELPEGITRPKNYDDVVYEKTRLEDSDVDYQSIASGLSEAANELGMDVVDLATIVSYETGGTFNPTKAGPTTKWGQHKGLIQFGEPQAKQYGVDWSNPYSSQLGKDGAIVKYFRQSGFKEGMGLLDAYSIVNAGSPGLYDRSDEAAGGAPGTVRDKVQKQMAGHKAKARRLVEEYLK